MTYFWTNPRGSLAPNAARAPNRPSRVSVNLNQISMRVSDDIEVLERLQRDPTTTVAESRSIDAIRRQLTEAVETIDNVLERIGR